MFFLKITTALEARHPNFMGRYYSHLLFHKSSYLDILVIFQLTAVEGLLIFNGGASSNSSVAIILKDGAVQFCLNYDHKQLCRKAYEVKVCYAFINFNHISVLSCMNAVIIYTYCHFVLNC